MDILQNKTCVPCQGGVPTLTDEESENLLPQVPGWEVVEDDGMKKLKKKFDLKNFKHTLGFVNQVGELAEANGHHPVMLVEFRAVTIWWWTHKIGGLHENDFIMAAKSNQVD